MKRHLTLLVAIVAICAGASPNKSGWIESFDKFKNYPYDGTKTLPAPWEGAVGIYAHTGIGHDGSAAIQRPRNDWNWGHAYRRSVEDPRIGDTLVARIFRPTNIHYQSVFIGLTTDTTPGSSGQFAGGAKVAVHITGSADKRFAAVSFRVTDADDRTYMSTSAAAHPFLPADQWYDFRLTLAEGRTVIAEYKHVDMSYWVPLDTLKVPDDFQPNYVAISATRQAIIDDVGYIAADKSSPLFTR